MSRKTNGGFILPGYDPLRSPGDPINVEAFPGNTQVTISFNTSTQGSAPITSFVAVSQPDSITASGGSSPITLTGLTNNTSYTFQVWAINSYGPSPLSTQSNSTTPVVPRGLFGGGTSDGSTRTNVIQYVIITTTGNAIDFGDLTVARYSNGACASHTRAVFGGGNISGDSFKNVVDYITISTIGNATDFGDLTANGRENTSGVSNRNRGVFIAGSNSTTGPGFMNVIDIITISTTGNALDFGDTGIAREGGGSCGSPTRGLLAGGYDGTFLLNNIDYITLSTLGNAFDFGDLSNVKWYPAGASNSTRGLFAGGSTSTGFSGASAVCDYVTIASQGNFTNFGNLTSARWKLASSSSTTTAIFAGGRNTSDTAINVIDYYTISTTGAATDFGDLLGVLQSMSGTSNAHGGLI